MDDEQFWEQVREVARTAGRAYLATVAQGKPTVRVVFPAFEGRRIWIATQRGSAKLRHLARDPNVALFWETGASRPAAHLAVSGTASLVDDQAEKKRVWDAKLFGYNLTEFWPRGPASDDFSLLAIEPQRVELGWQPAMWSGQRPKVWKG
jgi:general stress protein 26